MSTERKIILSLSNRLFDESDEIKDVIEKRGLDLLRLNPLVEDKNQLKKDLENVPWEKVHLIETREVRSWQKDWEKYSKALNEIKERVIKEEKQSGRQIKFANPLEGYHWSYDKYRYLKELAGKEVKVVQTEKLSAEQEFSLAAYMSEHNWDQLVMKPGSGSRALGVIFVSYDKDDDRYKLSMPYMAEGKKPAGSEIHILDREVLGVFVNNYRDRFKTHGILLQEFLPGIEISAAFIGNAPHFIMRTAGYDTRVAHEKFGGDNILERNPPNKVRDFARQVADAVSESIGRLYYNRVDMIWNQNSNMTTLLEVEVMAPRLFLHSSGKVQKYAEEVLINPTKGMSSVMAVGIG